MIGYLQLAAFRIIILAVVGSIIALVLIRMNLTNDAYFATVTQTVIADYFAEAKALGVQPSIQDVLQNYCFHPNAHGKDNAHRGDIACGAAVLKTFPTRLNIDQAGKLLTAITVTGKREGFSAIQSASEVTPMGSMIYESSGGLDGSCGLSVTFSNDDPAILRFPGYKADIQYNLMCSKSSPDIPTHFHIVPD